MNDLFNNEGYVEPIKPTKFCRTCAHRQPWECGQNDTLEEIEKYIGNNSSVEAEFIKSKINELKML